VKDENIIKAISDYVSTNNRSEVAKTAHNTLIIDCYNANPSSMASALESFVMIPHESKLAIIGDMLELGSEAKKEHEKIIQYCEANNINYISVGENFATVNSNKESKFLSSDELISFLTSTPLKNKLILLKGSRGIALEKLVPVL
jgi:UDP-N-acetylmuramoyl-tripeptide--D-alanyl-D-alanine ligase